MSALQKAIKLKNERISAITSLLSPSVYDFTFTEKEGQVTAELLGREFAFYRDDYPTNEDWFSDNLPDISDDLIGALCEYGLEFTFDDEEQCYRYVISTGGPHEEIRFYVDKDKDLINAKFVYLDWGDRIDLNLSNNEIADFWDFLSAYT